MAVTPEQVRDALKEVFDPEIPVSIVDLGLIYDIKVDPEDVVHVTMTLTTPGCGMAQQIAYQAKDKAKAVAGVKDAKVTVVWEPAWNPNMMSDEAKKKLGVA